MIMKYLYVKILWLVIILCIYSSFTYANSDVWRKGPGNTFDKTSIQRDIQSLSDGKLLSRVTASPYSEYVIKEIVKRGNKTVIPVLESLSTTYQDSNKRILLCNAIVSIELSQSTSNQNDYYKLKSLMIYKMKYALEKDEYRDQSPFTQLTSLRAVRYWGAEYQCSSLLAKLQSRELYQEIIDLYSEYQNDSNEKIKSEAVEIINDVNRKISLKQQRQLKYQSLSKISTPDLNLLIDIKNSNQVDPVDAALTCIILRERKETGSIPALIAYSFQTAGDKSHQSVSSESVKEACKSIVTLENWDSLNGKSVEEKARNILIIQKKSWKNIGPGHKRLSPLDGLKTIDHVIEFGCDALLMDLIKQDRASVAKVATVIDLDDSE